MTKGIGLRSALVPSLDGEAVGRPGVEQEGLCDSAHRMRAGREQHREPPYQSRGHETGIAVSILIHISSEV